MDQSHPELIRAGARNGAAEAAVSSAMAAAPPSAEGAGHRASGSGSMELPPRMAYLESGITGGQNRAEHLIGMHGQTRGAEAEHGKASGADHRAHAQHRSDAQAPAAESQAREEDTIGTKQPLAAIEARLAAVENLVNVASAGTHMVLPTMRDRLHRQGESTPRSPAPLTALTLPSVSMTSQLPPRSTRGLSQREQSRTGHDPMQHGDYMQHEAKQMKPAAVGGWIQDCGSWAKHVTPEDSVAKARMWCMLGVRLRNAETGWSVRKQLGSVIRRLRRNIRRRQEALACVLS